MKDLDYNIKKLLSQEIYIPNSYKNMVRNTLDKQKSIKISKKYSFIKIASTVCASLLLTTGVVFAKDIKNTVQYFFSNSKGMDTAIENGYISEPNIQYIESNGTEAKIDNLLMDDFNLSFTLSVKLDDSIDVAKIKRIRLPTMIITDEKNRILYCQDENTFYQYCKKNNLNYVYSEFNDSYINSGSNWYIKAKNSNENTLDLVYNLYANNYPKSKKLYIDFTQINMSENEVSENEETALTGNWNINLNIPEEFYNREALIYQVEKCCNPDFNIQNVVVYNTGTKIYIQTEESPDLPYDENDDDKTKEIKLEQYMKELQNMTLDDYKSSRKFKNEYIENENGEKFYPSNSNSDDSGYSNTEMKYLNYWQTFSMTKYNATDKLNIYINYKGEDVIIQLKRK